MKFSFQYFLVVIIIIIPLLELHKLTEAINYYETCKKEFICGRINITYPFHDRDKRPDYCGYPGFKLNCNDYQSQIVMTSSELYHLKKMNKTSHTVTVSRDDYWSGFCPQKFPGDGWIMNWELFNLTPMDENVTLYYGCDQSHALDWMDELQFPCPGLFPGPSLEAGYFMTKTLKDKHGDIPQGLCKANILTPFNGTIVNSISNISGLQAAFNSGFELEYYAENDKCDACWKSHGECGWNTEKNEFVCYCSDGTSDSTCGYGPTKSKKYNLRLILAASATGITILIIVLFYFRRKFLSQHDHNGLSHAKVDIEAFLKAHGSLAPKRYTYGELKQITKSFKEKLGEGSFGTVYKGELHNQHLVAVKLLKKSEGNANDFINEVASIGRTNHVNVVTLLGFCFHGNKKGLVFDYMPNGSLDKFIRGRNSQLALPLEKLFQIAIGIARGLEYLHQGCNTRIVHFDIKPHIILLDENFCPKISDFGLARSCPRKESIISLSGVKGTVGFIAPEVFLNGFGRVSYKSDVYSYGMLVLEMIGRRKGADPKVDNGSEEYFPQWIYRELEQVEEANNQGIENGEDKVLVKKMILVSLWCIQTHPSSRPSMTRVVEMLEGSLESLQHPPVPTLFSPSISLPNSSNLNKISWGQHQDVQSSSPSMN